MLVPSSTALRNDGYVPLSHERRQSWEWNTETTFHVDHADAVGPDKTDTVFLCGSDHLFFEFSSFIAEFPEAGGFNNGSADTFSAALFQHPGHETRRYQNHGHIDLIRDIRYRFIDSPGGNNATAGADRVNDPVIAEINQVQHNIPAQVVFLCRYTNNRHTLWIEDFFHNSSTARGKTGFSIEARAPRLEL